MRKNLRSERALGMTASEWLREVIRMRTIDVLKYYFLMEGNEDIQWRDKFQVSSLCEWQF